MSFQHFLPIQLFFLRAFVKIMLPPGALFELKLHQNVYAARVSPWTPFKKLTELPDPLAGFQGADSQQGTEGKGRVREGRMHHVFISPHCTILFPEVSTAYDSSAHEQHPQRDITVQ